MMMSAVALERDYMQDKKRAIYIALEELDFMWDWDDITAFERMWELGWDAGRIAKGAGERS